MENKITIHRSTPTVAVLTNLYNAINETIQDNEAYYTEEQIKELKKNPNNIFLDKKKGVKHE